MLKYLSLKIRNHYNFDNLFFFSKEEINIQKYVFNFMY